jgi:hypothetical protein
MIDRLRVCVRASVLVLGALNVGVSTAGPITNGSPSAPIAGMRLTFDDEFDHFSRYVGPEGEDICKPGGSGTWQTVLNVCRRMNSGTSPNGQRYTNFEQQIYMDEGYLGPANHPMQPTLAVNPFHVQSGVLAISAAPINPALKAALGTEAEYTSGIITTQDSFSQQFGYFEARLKLPRGKGLWPAFWLMAADAVRPPEIDVLEAFGSPNAKGEGAPTRIHYHSIVQARPDPLSGPARSDCFGWHDVGVDITEGFHTYGVNIEPDQIDFYFDGRPYVTCPPNPTANRPLYMLVSLSVGGIWPGNPDRTNIWPAHLYVDYVRVYQKIQ